MRHLGLAALLLLGCAAPRPSRPPAVPKAPASEGAELIGKRPPEWTVERWLGTAPLRLADLRGKVVLVRWWTAGCPICSASAPALRDFHRRYADRGLVVVGLYHHKDDGPFDPALYEKTARDYGFTFPVGFDPDWRTLRAWWLTGDARRSFTSVSILLDRTGAVRHVHPGGQYVAGEPDHAALGRAIESLLKEP